MVPRDPAPTPLKAFMALKQRIVATVVVVFTTTIDPIFLLEILKSVRRTKGPIVPIPGPTSNAIRPTKPSLPFLTTVNPGATVTTMAINPTVVPNHSSVDEAKGPNVPVVTVRRRTKGPFEPAIVGAIAPTIVIWRILLLLPQVPCFLF
jgi:hypothetical protein